MLPNTMCESQYSIFKRRRSESLIEGALSEGAGVRWSVFKTKLQGCSKKDKEKSERANVISLFTIDKLYVLELTCALKTL